MCVFNNVVCGVCGNRREADGTPFIMHNRAYSIEIRSEPGPNSIHTRAQAPGCSPASPCSPLAVNDVRPRLTLSCSSRL